MITNMINLNFIVKHARLKNKEKDILSIVLTGSARYINKKTSDNDYVVVINDNSSLNNKNYQVFSDLYYNNDYIIYTKSELERILFNEKYHHINKQFLFLDFAKGYEEDGYLIYGSKIFEYDLSKNKDFVKNYFKNFIIANSNSIIKQGINISKRLYQAFNFMFLYNNNFKKLNSNETQILELKNKCLKLPMSAKIDFYNFYEVDANFVYEYEYYEELLNTNKENNINYSLKKEKEISLKNKIKQKRDFLLKNFKQYVEDVKYGIINESEIEHKNMIEWYEKYNNNDLISLSYPPDALLK